MSGQMQCDTKTTGFLLDSLAQATGWAHVPLTKIGRLEELWESSGQGKSAFLKPRDSNDKCRERVQGAKKIYSWEGPQKLGVL